MQIALPNALLTGFRHRILRFVEAQKVKSAHRAEEDLLRREAARLFRVSPYHLDDVGLSHLAPHQTSTPILPQFPRS